MTAAWSAAGLDGSVKLLPAAALVEERAGYRHAQDCRPLPNQNAAHSLAGL